MAEVKLNIVVDGVSGAVRSVSSLVGEMDKLDVSSRKASKGLDITSAALKGIGAGVLAVSTFLAAGVTQLARYGSQISDLSARTAFSTRTLQEWRFAASLVGVETQEVAQGAAKMAKAVTEGSSVFRRLGLDLQQLRAMSPEEQFRAVAAAIAAIRDPTQQAAAAMEGFGKGGAALLPLIRSDLAGAAEEARRLGLILSDETIAAADKLDDEVTKLGHAWDVLTMSIGGAILPEVTAAVQALTTWIARNKDAIVEWVRGAIEVAKAALSGLRSAIEVITAPLRLLISIFAELVQHGPLVATAIGTIGVAVTGALGPVGLLSFALAGLLALFPRLDPETRAATVAIGAFGVALTVLLGPLGLVITGVGLLVAAIERLKLPPLPPMSAEFRKDLEDTGKAAVTAVGAAFPVVNQLAGAVKQLSERMNEGRVEAERWGMGVRMMAAARTTLLVGTSIGHLQSFLPPPEQVRFATEEQRRRAEQAQEAWVRAAEGARKEWDAFYQDLRDPRRLGSTFQEEINKRTRTMFLPPEKQLEAVLRGGTGVGAGDTLRELEQLRTFGPIAEVDEIVVKFIDWRQALQDVTNAFQVLGISSDSMLGRVLGGLTAGANALAQMKALAGGLDFSKLGALFSGKLGPEQLLGGIGAGLQLGAAAVSIGKGIVGLFTDSPAEKAAKAAARAFGERVSKELAEAIAETAEKLDVDFNVASLLHLTDAMDELGKKAHDMAPQVAQLMAGIANGTIPAREGLEQLDDVFRRVREEADAAGVVGDRMTVTMLRQAQATGQLTDEMRAFLKAQDELITKGAAALAGGLEKIDPSRLSAASGEAAARFFALGFQQAMDEGGILGALDALGEQVLSARDKFRESGNEAAAAFLDPFARMQEVIGGDEHLRGLLEMAHGMGQIFEGAANKGTATVQMFSDLGSVLADTQEQLEAGGLNTKDSIAAIMPELTKLVSAAQQAGVALDPVTQGLVDQAKEMGFVFPVDPFVQIRDVLVSIAEVLGADVPSLVTASSTAVTGLGTTATTTLDSIGAASVGVAETASAGWVQASATIGSSLNEGLVPLATGAFEHMGTVAQDTGDWVKVSWHSGISLIAGAIDDTVPKIEEGFGRMRDVAVEPLNTIIGKVHAIGAGFDAATQAAQTFGHTLSHLDSSTPSNSNNSGPPEKTAQVGLPPTLISYEQLLRVHPGEQVEVAPVGERLTGGRGGSVQFGDVHITAPPGLSAGEGARFGRDAARSFIQQLRRNHKGLKSEVRAATSDRR